MDLATPLLKRHLAYPRFKNRALTILLIDSGYFGVADCRWGLERLGHRVVTIALGADYIRRLLTLLVEVKPDFLLTVNHLGFDEEGSLTGLLESLKLPFASWFVDSPAYILNNGAQHVSDYCAVFCWERTYLPWLAEMGFKEPAFLPLATNPELFKPRAGGGASFTTPLSFVGDSLCAAVAKWQRKVPGDLWEMVAPLAVTRQLADRRRPMGAIMAELAPLIRPEADLIDLEAALAWKVTQEYRHRLTRALLPQGVVVYGDPGWRDLLGDYPGLRPPVHYRAELPRVYAGSAVNLNATSFQMPSAVNQRVFDVAAAGGFLLSDHQGDMDLLFEVGKEAVCYETIEDAAALAAWYLRQEGERLRIIEEGRRRVLAEHTYDRRMHELVSRMRTKFA